MGDVGAKDGRERSRIWVLLGQKMGECRSFLRGKWSKGLEESDRLYEGNGAEDGWERIVCTVQLEKSL